MEPPSRTPADASPQQTWRLLSRGHAATADYLNREMERESGLRLDWYELLTVLANTPGGQVPQQNLLNEVTLTQSGLSRMVNRMEEASLIRRLPLAGDKRAAVVQITRAGRTAIRQATPGHVRRLRERLESLSPVWTEALGAAAGADEDRPHANIMDAMLVRDALEPLILQEATRYRQHSDIAELRALLEVMRDCLTDRERFQQANWDLHERVAAIGRNPLLVDTYLSALDICRREAGSVPLPEGLELQQPDRLRIHEDLVDAIASGDMERLAAATEAHQVTHFITETTVRQSGSEVGRM